MSWGVIGMNLDNVRKKKKGKMKKRLLFRTVILSILVVAIIYALVSNINKDKEIYEVGDKAPDFTLQQVNKNNEIETVQLSDYEGKGIMLNFWATFCKPCEKEMPYMQKLYPEYKERGIEIIAVSLDATELVVEQFIDRYDLTFPIPHDKTGEIRDLYKIGPLPSTVFINSEGKIERTIIGAQSLERLEEYLQEIIPNP